MFVTWFSLTVKFWYRQMHPKRVGVQCVKGYQQVGQWSKEEQLLHINVLELKAVKLALLTFNKQKSLKAIHFHVDNTTAQLYLVNIGGTGNQMLLKLSKEIWQYLLKHQITITSEYLPSSFNVEADWQSRNSKDPSEWKLCQKCFNKFARGEKCPK